MDSASTPAVASANLSIDIVAAAVSAPLPATEQNFYAFILADGDPDNNGPGTGPHSSPMQASDGNFYGAAFTDGLNNDGTLYMLTPSGQETILHTFNVSVDGAGPGATPIEASDGNLYGTTTQSGIQFGGQWGEVNYGGSIYKYNFQTGAFTTLYTFTKNTQAFTGGGPSGVIDDGKGILYGAASLDGVNGMGSVWSFNYLTNTFTTLYSFTGSADGLNPGSNLVLASDGKLYGTAQKGGANGNGAVFALNTDGSNFTVIHSFTAASDGADPGSLIQYPDGNLYGSTLSGGPNGGGVFFQIVPNGANSTFNIIYQFQVIDGTSDGYQVSDAMIGGDGKFYIVGRFGGTYGIGQVMQLDTLGHKADVYDFGTVGNDNGTDGAYPLGPPLESIDGNLYGTTTSDGPNGYGNVYRLLTSLPPVISLTSTPNYVPPGEALTLSWAVTNAYSKDAQVCIARSSDNSWTGTVPISGSATVTPTGTGAIFYALTCGGKETATITVNGFTPLSVTTTSLPNGKIDTAYSPMQLAAGGGTPPYNWSITSGALPAGLSMAASTGIIAGIPTQAGTANFVVQVTDSESPAVTSTADLSLTVTSAPLAVATTSLSNGTVGAAYVQTLAATGGVAPYTWSVASGTLPAGLSLAAGSGILSGTPTQAGTASLAIQVKDSAGTTAIANLSLVINAAPPTITTTSLPGGMVGTAYSQTLAESGGTAPYTWSITAGALPAGLSITSSTGVISGTPTFAETSNFTVQIKDSSSTPVTGAAALSILISPAPALNTPTVAANVNPSSIAAGQATTLSAKVAGVSGLPAPTGAVQFQANGTNLGSPVTLSGGTATLSNQVFSIAGSYTITADYSGDTNYTPVNSSSVALTVTAATANTPAITANPTTVTISAPGGTGSTMLTFSNFSSSAISITCTGLPKGATCNPGTVSSSSGATTSVLQIATTGAAAANSNTDMPARRGGLHAMYALALPGLLAITGLFSTGRQWRQKIFLLLLLGAGITLTACSGGAKVSPDETPTGTSNVTLTATAGSQSATVNLTLVVQ